MNPKNELKVQRFNWTGQRREGSDGRYIYAQDYIDLFKCAEDLAALIEMARVHKRTGFDLPAEWETRAAKAVAPFSAFLREVPKYECAFCKQMYHTAEIRNRHQDVCFLWPMAPSRCNHPPDARDLTHCRICGQTWLR